MYRNCISFFPYFWKYYFFNDFSNIIFKGIVTESLQIFIIDTLSYPCNLLESNDFIIDNISLFETQKELILVLVLYKRVVNTLSFFVGVHIEAEKVIEKICSFALV